MKYLKFFFKKFMKCVKGIIIKCSVIFMYLFFFLLCFWTEGYTLEDFGIYDVNLNPNDYCHLTDVNYTAVLRDDPNGKANVEITEYITFDVHAASKSNPFKELWRELPEQYVDGLKVTYDVKSVTQIMDNGTEIPYLETSKMYWEDSDYNLNSIRYWHHSDGDGRYPDNDESLLIYIPWTYREKMTFKIVYSMNNAALKYNDCSELYLSLYSGNTITKLKSYKAQILIPNDIMPTLYHAYTFGTSNNRLKYRVSSSNHPGYTTFSINLDKSDLKFNYHNRYIEFCLLSYGRDKHIFTKYAPNNAYSNEDVLDECIAENEYYESQNRKINNYKLLLFLGSIIISIVIICNTKHKYNKIKKKYDINKPETEYEYFRDIPSDLDPIFASELVFMKDPFNENKEKQEEYAAILLSLVRKKYISISKVDNNKEWNDSNTLIIVEPIRIEYETPEFIDSPDYSPEPICTTVNNITGITLEPLTTSERLYYELLEKYSKSYTISLSSLKNNLNGTDSPFAKIIEEKYIPDKYTITIENFQQQLNQNYLSTAAFVKNIEKKPILEAGVMQGYFLNANYDMFKKDFDKKAKSSLICGLILLIFVNFISYFTPLALGFGAYTILGIICIWKYIYLTEKANDLLLFTQFGINEQAKWYGLYNFLNSDTLIKEKEVQDLVLWEKYLIYATAFGISEKVVKAVKIHAQDLNINTSPILNNRCYIHSTNFHKTSRSFGRSIHTPSRGGGFGGHGYGGGFGGHGYGGGGRGGGGGGGGH